MNTTRTRALGIALGFLADLTLADPARLHPVAGFGRVALALESALHPVDPVVWGDRVGPGAPNDDPAVAGVSDRAERTRGVAFTVVLVGGVAASTAIADRMVAGRPALRVATTALTVWACLGGTSLLRVAERHADLLARHDVPGSRELLPWLCGRDPDALDAEDLARAVVESVAENTSDAAVATLFWAAVAGPAGAAAHRAVNTLDAMVGYRSPRYVRFGWASARLDDLMGWPAARAAGLLTAAVSPVVGGAPGQAIGVWRRDARSHPSPNAGVVESTCAGALGVRLGGRTAYPHGVEKRPVLGDDDAPTPTSGDVRRAVRLLRWVQVVAAGLAAAGLLAAARPLAAAGAGVGQPRSRSARRNARRRSTSSRCP